jgi:hypothetical protein
MHQRTALSRTSGTYGRAPETLTSIFRDGRTGSAASENRSRSSCWREQWADFRVHVGPRNDKHRNRGRARNTGSCSRARNNGARNNGARNHGSCSRAGNNGNCSRARNNRSGCSNHSSTRRHCASSDCLTAFGNRNSNSGPDKRESECTRHNGARNNSEYDTYANSGSDNSEHNNSDESRQYNHTGNDSSGYHHRTWNNTSSWKSVVADARDNYSQHDISDDTRYHVARSHAASARVGFSSTERSPPNRPGFFFKLGAARRGMDGLGAHPFRQLVFV